MLCATCRAAVPQDATACPTCGAAMDDGRPVTSPDSGDHTREHDPSQRPLFAPPSPNPAPAEPAAPAEAAAPTRDVEPPAARLFRTGSSGPGGAVFAPAQGTHSRGPATPPPTTGPASRRIALGGEAAPAPGPAPDGAPPPGPPPPGPHAGSPPASRPGPPGPTPSGHAPAATAAPSARSAGPAPAAQPPAAVSGGPLVGRLDGEPIRDVVMRSLWGTRVYAAAAALAFAMLILRGSRPLPTSPVGVGITLAAALLMVIGLLILVGMIAAVSRGRQSGSRTSGVVVRRFRVRALTGDLVSCVLPGDSADDDLRHGDCVRIEGRRRRDGDLSVHRVEVLESPAGPTLSVVHARGMGLRAAVVTDRICLALAVVLVLWVAADRLALIS